MISTEHDLNPGSVQYQWLEQDLAKVNRSITPWLVVAGHRPMYNSEKYDSDFRVTQNMQRMYEDLLIKYQVDITFFGHYHSYERTCPLAHGQCTAIGEGPVHITIGSAGASLDDVGLYGYDWSQYFDDDWGIGKVTVNGTGLTFQYIRNRDQTVVDEVTVYKKGHVVTTLSGCVCQQPWNATLNSQTTLANFYDCQNPNGDPRGTWCRVDLEKSPSTCNPLQPHPYDFCFPAQKTQSNCTCKSPFVYNGLKHYKCTDADADGFDWCYTGSACGTAGAGGWWDKC